MRNITNPPVYPIGLRVSARNDAGEVEHRDTIIVGRKFGPAGSPMVVIKPNGKIEPGIRRRDEWLYSLAGADYMYSGYLLTPIDDEDRAEEAGSTERPRQEPTAPNRDFTNAH